VSGGRSLRRKQAVIDCQQLGELHLSEHLQLKAIHISLIITAKNRLINGGQ